MKTDGFISLSEAAHYTGKSEMTIRRLSKRNEAKGHILKKDGAIFLRAEFVNSVYHFDNTVLTEEKPPKVEAITDHASLLQSKLEAKEELLKEKQRYIDHLENQFKEYREEKQKEIDRLHEKWSQEQEIFKRDQQLNAGKLITQSVQELDGGEGLRKKKWWQW